MSKPSPYEVLGMAPTATYAEIRKAFRQLALLNHPDKAGRTQEAHERMVLIIAAHDFLSVPASRAWYDGIKARGGAPNWRQVRFNQDSPLTPSEGPQSPRRGPGGMGCQSYQHEEQQQRSDQGHQTPGDEVPSLRQFFKDDLHMALRVFKCCLRVLLVLCLLSYLLELMLMMKSPHTDLPLPPNPETTPEPLRGYYADLDVPMDATAAGVHEAYKLLRRRHHPDKQGSTPEAHRRYLRITKAYEVLGDEGERCVYDAELGIGAGPCRFVYTARLHQEDLKAKAAEARKAERDANLARQKDKKRRARKAKEAEREADLAPQRDEADARVDAYTVAAWSSRAYLAVVIQDTAEFCALLAYQEVVYMLADWAGVLYHRSLHSALLASAGFSLRGLSGFGGLGGA